jgi:hypothetical protein
MIFIGSDAGADIASTESCINLKEGSEKTCKRCSLYVSTQIFNFFGKIGNKKKLQLFSKGKFGLRFCRQLVFLPWKENKKEACETSMSFSPFKLY